MPISNDQKRILFMDTTYIIPQKTIIKDNTKFDKK